jgi:hypothetical protein
MINENKSSYYPETKTSKQELYSPYNQLCVIRKQDFDTNDVRMT